MILFCKLVYSISALVFPESLVIGLAVPRPEKSGNYVRFFPLTISAKEKQNLRFGPG